MDISSNIAFRIVFLILCNVKFKFKKQKLRYGLYTTTKALPTTRQCKLVRKKKFAIATLNPNNRTFVVYILFLIIFDELHLFHMAKIAPLKVNEIFINVVLEYFSITDIFFL